MNTVTCPNASCRKPFALGLRDLVPTSLSHRIHCPHCDASARYSVAWFALTNLLVFAAAIVLLAPWDLSRLATMIWAAPVYVFVQIAANACFLAFGGKLHYTPF